MANVKRSRGTGGRARSHDHNSEEYVPYSGWSEDANGRNLIIDLPGNESTYLSPFLSTI
jgi:hypothetical protein